MAQNPQSAKLSHLNPVTTFLQVWVDLNPHSQMTQMYLNSLEVQEVALDNKTPLPKSLLLTHLLRSPPLTHLPKKLTLSRPRLKQTYSARCQIHLLPANQASSLRLTHLELHLTVV